ncbi:MAG: sigma-E factor regulatory protein RseB domain-containing protein [Armatimonadota bacterium]|nr:sigma-E factor regulatory protein RseB domain-containing protein [Armatimonadota bacterium]MDR5696850.1 sigma-E factor regulatory protein RseB domain-containing protein [Armatimonadota bacterium]
MSRVGVLLASLALLVAWAAGGSASVGAAAVPAPSPLEILKNAVRAPEFLDYEGTKVITTQRGDAVESITVSEWHRHPHAYRFEYLAPKGIAGRVLIDDGEVSWHYEPSVHLAIRGPSLGRPEAAELDRLPENYNVRLLGTDSVLGREAYLIALQPKRSGVERRFWVDRLTGLIVKSEESDRERGVFFTSTFVRISFSLNLPDAMFRFRLPAGARVLQLESGAPAPQRLSILEQRAGFRPVAPATLPHGYRYDRGGVSRFENLGAVVLRYTDGASSVSLFEMPANRMGMPPGGEPVRIGGLAGRFYQVGYFRVLMWERGGLHFAAVGSVPLEMLAAFAEGTDPNRESARLTEVARQAGVPVERVAALRDRGLTFEQILTTLRAAVPSVRPQMEGPVPRDERAPQPGPRPPQAPAEHRPLIDVIEKFQDEIRRDPFLRP